MRKKIHRLQVILKTSERCNLACTYCYYFFGGDESYKKRPPIIAMETVKQIGKFLRDGAHDHDIDVIEIVFHGGEPMLQKPRLFDQSCTILRTALEATPTRLNFSIQTNGTIISDEWIEVLNKHDVSIGISIDGPKEYNDRYRIDLRGRGSYESVEKGVKGFLQAKADQRLSQGIGTITVLNTEFNYRKIYQHLNAQLGIQRFSFLLPDTSYDTGFPPGTEAEQYGTILCNIFDAWLAHPGTSVRNIDEIMHFFQEREFVGQSGDSPPKWSRITGNQIIVLQSDGEVSVDDSLIPASRWRNTLAKFHVANSTLKNYLEQDFFDTISSAQNNIPSQCDQCAWKKLCRGGDIENRFSSVNGFDNPSIYCAALKKFYMYVVKYLVMNGYPVNKIEEKLSA